MKKSHLILLIVTALTALFSAYSLAAINKVYKLDFGWYSSFSNVFISEYRDLSEDRWKLPDYPHSMKFIIFGGKSDIEQFQGERDNYKNSVIKNDYSKYILFYCAFGEVHSPEYRIKFADVAQRGGVIEIKINVNSPEKSVEDKNIGQAYYPEDLIRIDKSMFSVKGELHFVFKNQDGKQLYEQQFKVK
jgi:hypothetical protein